MRIFSKKALQFDHPAGAVPAVIVRASEFADVPNWVSDSTMFKWSSEDGDITVIESKQDEIKAETGAPKGKTKAEKEAEAKAKAEAEAKAAEAAAEAAEEAAKAAAAANQQ